MSVAQIKSHFQRVDPVISKVMADMPLQVLVPKPVDSYFGRLCQSIIGQQLAGKAADAIVLRFNNLLDGQVDPQSVLNVEADALRNVGMSWAKVRSVKDLSAKVINHDIQLEKLPNLDDETVITELIKVKGIGRWTAEMFLMFTLAREDVFSHGDLGLRKGIEKLYGFTTQPSPDQVEKAVGKWSPYKTYGCLALWQSVDQ